MIAERVSATTTELVQRCLRGDSHAWVALVDRYASLVKSVALRHGLSAPEAEEIVQDVFAALAQTLHTIEDPERLPGWLLTAARRLCWRAVQKRRREAPHEGADLSESDDQGGAQPLFVTIPSMEEMTDNWHKQEMLGAGLARLGERCRTLLSLLFLADDEPSYDDVARQTGIARGGIGPTRTRCLQQLRSILEGLGFARD